ncbi:CxxxxCH/CxxCH domain-containing protein [Geobacter pelophilus]|uniref:CxxxxCH/CxxCH domain-containing protein n=1 Tax=Geoanaerobacter pelophilus TaxID=60036 RepID=A0AAW4KYM8_9BACT|nr:CxxxxCH/CxxCH domain-containing protein [Geoanaerobacter pelophilus]
MLGSCSDVSCHFESGTRTWGAANFSSTASCSECHASPGTSTGHTKHDSYYTFATNGCNKCHPDYSSSPTFQHATSAGNRGIKVKLAEGSYSGTGLNYLPSQSGSRLLGNCANLYCHSNGTNNSTFTVQTTPQWGTNLNCSSCHITGTTLSTGTHGKHVNATIATPYACYKCHAATVNGTNAVVSLADHVDRLVTVKYSNTSTAVNGTYNGVNASTGKTALTPGTRAATCTNIYCHSYGTAASGTFRVMSTPRWGGAMPSNCTGCHGGTSAVNGKFRLMSTGRHTKHARGTDYATANTYYNYGCVDCHNATVSDNTTVSNVANHVNNKVDVGFTATWGGSYPSTGHAPGLDTTRTCQNVYCHSNAQDGGQPGTAMVFRNLTGSKTWWGSATSLGCSGCHQSTSGSNLLSGKHSVHVSTTFNPAIGTGLSCGECHSAVRSVAGAWVDRSKHANKLNDYSGAKARGSANYVSSTGVCANLYCHSNGKGTFKSMATDNWFSASTLGCDGCHGSAATYGSPNYASGAAGSLTANSHAAHVKSAADCVNCHYKTTTTGTTIATGSTDHVDMTVDARFKLLPFATISGSYNNVARSCSNTYCHGTGTAPVWGANGTLKCDSCHSNQGAGIQAGGFVGAHQRHAGNAGTYYNYACDQCHATKPVSPLTGAAHAGGAVSTTQAANVVFSNNSTVWRSNVKYGDDAATSFKYRSMYNNPFVGAVTPAYAPGTAQTADKGYAWTNGTCSTVWCHSNAAPAGGTNNYVSPTWTNGALACTACHGGSTGTGGTGLSSIHGRHVSGGTGFAYTCDKCHANTVAAGSNGTLNATTGLATHVNAVKDVNYDAFNTGAGYASQQCSNVYCHSNGKGTFVAPAALRWTTAADGACGTCHSLAATFASNNTHFAHFSSSNGPKLSKTATVGCVECHTYTAENGATHIDKSFNVLTTGNCTTNCHKQIASGAAVAAWSTGAVACRSCHVTTASVISGTTAPLMNNFSSYGHGAGNIGTGKSGNACTDCHDANSSHITGTLGDSNRLKPSFGTGMNKNDNTSCTVCHNTTTVGTAARNLPGHYVAADGKSALGCRNCHNPHGSGTNSHMITNQIAFFSTTTQSISFTGTEFVNLVTNRGLCQVCHRATKYYRAGVAETVHFTTNCLQCHTHAGGGVAAFAASACDSCHGYPPVARNVGYSIKSNIGRLNNYTGAKFEDYSGGGGAHSVAAHVSPTAKPGDGFNACATCHNLGSSAHNGTTPVKSNIANVSVKLTQTKQFKSGTLSIYSSAKFVTPPNNKSGTCFNLNCHIGKSLKWSTEK